MTREVGSVLQIHTRYRQLGGEDRAVEAERQLLADAGVRVATLRFDNSTIPERRSIAQDLRLAGSAIWSRASEAAVRRGIREHRPDIVHVHNTFAAASPSVFRAAKALGIPVVHTLHNYRLVCPVATLYRAGRICHDCVALPVAAPAVIHACVRGSRSQSLVSAATLAIHRAARTFSTSIDAFIALTRFQAALIGQAYPNARIEVVPNFLEPDPGVGAGERRGVLYVGRLAEEKGIGPLLGAAEARPGLVSVAGDGPLRPAVEAAAAAGHLEYLGPLPPARVPEAMKGARAVIVPSLWYEGFPMVVLEAYATGTPVIASRIGSLAEVVDEGVTGILVEAGSAPSIVRAIDLATSDPEAIAVTGTAARRLYEERYRGARHLGTLMALYGSVVGARPSPWPRSG